ncbi:MAG: adenylate/guanylate cyclase domain-containing protein [Bacteroidota bacterium]
MQDPFLNSEVIKSEKKRLEVFLGVLLTGLLVISILRIFYYEQLQSAFSNEISYLLLFGSVLLMFISMLLARRWVIRVSEKGGRLTKRYYSLTMAIEVLVPSFMLVAVSLNEWSADYLNSPTILMYFILLIVSSMHLSFWFSTIMGVSYGVFYAIYTYWVTNAYPMESEVPLFIYYSRSGIYVLGGICAGLVAGELRSRLTATYKNIQEREEIEGLFSQQISKELVEVLKTKKDYAERLIATLLFLDIRDFTEKVQNLSPEEVNGFQNSFFSPIIEIINDQKGIVNQIMGDGLMATFGVPITDNQHHHYAWKAVKAILAFVEKFRAENPNHQLLDIGIGLHIGEILVGNIGTETRKQLSISGKPVIIASRIEQFNKELNSTLLMSGELYDLLVYEIGAYKSKSAYKLKGIDEEVTIVQIL